MKEDYLETVTTLRRSRWGNVYHRADCPRLKASLPWIWAEGKTRAEVAETLRNGLRPCQQCKPLEALPEAES
jgi:methylphosphotriester-DNA--protein-cysteine methyltransferase